MRRLVLVAALVALSACDEAAQSLVESGYPVLLTGDPLPTAAELAPRVAQPALPQDAAFDTAFNAYRGAAGLPPASANAMLAAMAMDHARAMAESGLVTHDLPGRGGFPARLAAGGFGGCQGAENLAQGQSSAVQALAEWAASPGHIANLQLSGPVEYGLAEVGSYYVLILSQLC